MSVNQQLSQPAQGLVNLDQYYPNVSLLLHMNGSNGSTTFTDSSLYPKTVTALGTAQVSTTQSKFGNSSGYFDGSETAYLSTQTNTDFTLGSSNFTFEMWIYPVAGGGRCLFARRSAGWGVGDYIFSINLSDGSIAFYSYEYDSGGAVPLIGGTGLTLNTWQHIVLQRSGNAWAIYRNGITIVTATRSTSLANNGFPFLIGQDDSPFFGAYSGYMADFRFTKGVARYTSNFNPPGAPFPDNSYSKFYSDPDYSSVSLLLHGDGSNGGTTFTDNSRFTRTPSAISNAVTSTTQKKFGVASIYMPAVTAGQLRYASSTDFNISGVNFTIEMWFYQTGGVRSLLCRRDTVGGGFTGGWVLTAGEIRANINGVWNDGQISWTAPGLNSWNHIAWVMSGTTMSVYLNGTLVGTKTSVTTISDIATTLDFGQASNGGENVYQGFIDDFRFTRGVARYTSDFTPPAAPHPNLGVQSNWIDNIYADQYYGNTVLLAHLDGANGGTTTIDSSPQRSTISVSGTAQTSTTVAKWGASSGYVNVSGGFSTTNFVYTFTGNFTVECWIYLVTSPAVPHDIVKIGSESSGRYVWYLNSAVLTSNLFGSPSNPTYGTLNLSTWYHLAFVRVGSTITVYVNGISAGTDTQAGTLGNDGTLNFLSGSSFTAYIDDLRITKGVARYTSNFTPPTAPFPNLAPPGYDPFYQRTSLLLHMDGSNGSTTFTDNSPTPNSITRVGTPTISSSIVKYGSGSGVFNGTSDYLTISPVSAFDFNTENFTIEAWIYPTELGTQNRYIFSIAESLVGNFAYTYFGVLANGTLTAWVQPTTGGGGSAVSSGAGAISTNTWTYVTLTRQGTSAFIFINGVLVNQTSSWLTYPSAKVQFVAVGAIANGYTDSTVGRFSGYIDDLRITKGVARYTANFQPPTGPFPNR